MIAAGSEGDWDSISVGDPAVILDGDTYKVWYVGRNDSGRRMIYAESDDGKNWTNFQQSIDMGNIPGIDENWLRFPVVVKFGQMYKMWYSAGPGISEFLIVYCDSWDGVSWNNFEVVLEAGALGDHDGCQVWSPHVLFDGEIYKMWYSGTNTGLTADRIIYCESYDGKDWSNFQTAVEIGNIQGFDDTAANSPTVLKEGGIYKMWYSGQVVGTEYFKISTIYCEMQQ